MIKHKPGKNDQPSHCYGSAREWLVARLNLLKAEKIGTKQGAFFLPTLPLQLTKIGNRLGDYAIPIVASNRRWIVPSTGKPWLRSKARIARRVPLPITPSTGPE